MSLFPIMRDFGDDPFMSGQMESMRQMESMMNSMIQPFGGMGMFGMGRADNRQRGGANRNSLMPFGFGQSLFPNMDSMFSNFGQMAQNPNCHSFSSSSVMTYTTDDTGRPQVYQATQSTRTAPGGVKETRESVQDSRSGLQKMAIGHHLNDQAHVVEKKKFRYTGEEEENHEYVNLDDEEADTFDHEWQRRAQGGFYPRQTHAAVDYGSGWRERSPDSEVLAITDGAQEPMRHSAERTFENKEKKKSSMLRKKAKHSNHKSGHSHGKPPYQ